MSTMRPVTRHETDESTAGKDAPATLRTGPETSADIQPRVKALKKRFPKILARLAE